MVKHVELGLCIIKKTGSRKLITWQIPLATVYSTKTLTLLKRTLQKTNSQCYNSYLCTEQYKIWRYLFDNGDINVESVLWKIISLYEYQCHSTKIHWKTWVTAEKISFKPIINSIEPAVEIPCLYAKLKYNSEIENDMTYETLEKTEGLF